MEGGAGARCAAHLEAVLRAGLAATPYAGLGDAGRGGGVAALSIRLSLVEASLAARDRAARA
jgi:hypothetical protein